MNFVNASSHLKRRLNEVFNTYKDNFICSHSNPKLYICEEVAVMLGKGAV